MIKAIKVVFRNAISLILRISKYILKALRIITALFVGIINMYYPSYYWLILIVIVWIITSILQVYLNQKNLGDSIPIPTKRFSEDVGDGEIRIENNRLEELILYVNELENYFVLNGFMDKE